MRPEPRPHVTAVHHLPVHFEKEGRTRRLRVGDVLDVEGSELVGMDGENPSVITNPTVWAGVTQPLRQAMAERIVYRGPWTFEANGTNSFIADFKDEA